MEVEVRKIDNRQSAVGKKTKENRQLTMGSMQNTKNQLTVSKR
jgi:hypothetical protein